MKNGIRSSNDWKITWHEKDIKTPISNTIRGQSAFVTQEPMLLNTSLIANITMTDEASVTEKELTQLSNCLTISGLTSWVESLKEGIHSQLGRGGIQPSGGQKKRILPISLL